MKLLRIIHHLLFSRRNDRTQDSGKKFNKTGLRQPNLDGISCIISNTQFHLGKKSQTSLRGEREREPSEISCSSRRLFRCPRHLLFRYFSYQADKGLLCLTVVGAPVFGNAPTLSFIFDPPFFFNVSLSLDSVSSSLEKNFP